MTIHCSDALSTVHDSGRAMEEVVGKLTAGSSGTTGDLAFVFATMHHADALERVSNALRDRGVARVVLGCTCESVIGEGREIEGSPALAVWSASLPGIDIAPFAVDETAGLPDVFAGEPVSGFLLLGDPHKFPVDEWFRRLGVERPGTPVFGGMASGGNAPGKNKLVLDAAIRDASAVGVALRGDVSIRSVVSQGCRPIGRSMLVTKTDRNIIRELGRRNALEVFQELFETLADDDQERVQAGLHLGRVINEYQETFGRGDFLVRNVMGADPSGGIAINDFVRVGQTVQFHVRDAETADEDLRQLLNEAKSEGDVAGALIFSCNGRGSRLFSEKNHDVAVLQELFGPIPAAGFFAMGELGPVGGQNFIHGFTASVVLFGEPSR